MSSDNIGDYLKKLRINSGFKTQKELSKTSGVSQTTLSRIEAGTQKPKPETLRTLSQHFDGVDYFQLMEKAGYVVKDLGEHLTPTMKGLLTDENINDLEKVLNKYIDLYVNMYSDSNGNVNEEFLEALGSKINSDKIHKVKNDIEYYDGNLWKEVLKGMGMDFKTFFLNFYIELLKDLELEEETGYANFRSQELEYLKDNNYKDRLVEYGESINLSILNNVPVKSPIFSEENILENNDFPNLWHLKTGLSFVLIAKDNSMIGARIDHGDYVIVKIQHSYQNDDIVVVNIDNNDGIIRRLKKTNHENSWLFPENNEFDPIPISDKKIKIVGKVVGLLIEEI